MTCAPALKWCLSCPIACSTYRSNPPIMRGKNFRIHCADCCEGSSDGGLMIFCETYWDTTSSTGRIRYAEASCQPMGGAPFTKGNSQLPAPWHRYRDVLRQHIEKGDACASLTKGRAKVVWKHVLGLRLFMCGWAATLHRRMATGGILSSKDLQIPQHGK